MAIEIEHKYLVKHDLWNKVIPQRSVKIIQGYLSSDPNKSVRVRSLDQKGFITVKGIATGAKRLEFEYEIPFNEALELLSGFCDRLISKTRHYVLCESMTWEVDVFDDANEGLIIAEIELASEDEVYSKPDWIDLEVTHDYRYSNSNLVHNPYSTW